MEDSELQRILAETVGESTRGVEALPSPEDDEELESEGVEVTVEDLVFTLRQIASAVIELKDQADLQQAQLDELRALVVAKLDEQQVTQTARLAELQKTVGTAADKHGTAMAQHQTAFEGLVKKVDALTLQVAAVANAMPSVVREMRTASQTLSRATAIPSGPATPSRTALPPTPVPPPVAVLPPPPAVPPPPPPAPHPTAERPSPRAAQDFVATAKVTVPPAASAPPPAPPPAAPATAQPTSEADAKLLRSHKSDNRKITFTARLKRKMLEAQQANPAAAADPAAATPATPPAQPEPTTAEAQPRRTTAQEPPRRIGPGSSTQAKDGPYATQRVMAIRRPEGENAPKPATTPSAAAEAAAAPASTLDTASLTAPPAAAAGPLNQGDVPVAAAVKQCQKQVFNLKLAVGALVRAGKIPRTDKPLHADVVALLNDLSNRVLKESLERHNRHLAAAQARYLATPIAAGQTAELFWSAEMIEDYKQFRTEWFMVEVLDKVDALLHRLELPDHRPLIDLLAMEMDLALVDAVEGTTEFDPKRHRLKEGSPSNISGDLYKAVVTSLFKPGYHDLATGQTIRKAVVKTRMQAR